MKIEISNGRADRSDARRRPRGVALHRRGQDRRRSARRRRAGAPTASIDAAGLVVCPGLVDLSARLREPGLEYKATLESEMARRGRRRRDQPRLPARHRSAARRAGPGRDAQAPRALAQPGARLSGRRADGAACRATTLTEMGELAEAGCVAFSQADAPLADTQVLLRAMQYAATFGYRVWLRPQDPHLGRGGVAHDGEVATRLGLPAIPAVAETIALATILALVRETGVRVHLCRLSSRRRRGDGPRREAGGPAGHLRRRRPSPAPVRRRHRLVRRRSANLVPPLRGDARPRRAARRASPTARSTSSAPTTRRSTTTASRCRSARPSPARPGWNSCCR